MKKKKIGLQVDGTTVTGLKIDYVIGNNLGPFKTFDKFENGVATSIKSIRMIQRHILRVQDYIIKAKKTYE